MSSEIYVFFSRIFARTLCEENENALSKSTGVTLNHLLPLTIFFLQKLVFSVSINSFLIRKKKIGTKNTYSIKIIASINILISLLCFIQKNRPIGAEITSQNHFGYAFGWAFHFCIWNVLKNYPVFKALRIKIW